MTEKFSFQVSPSIFLESIPIFSRKIEGDSARRVLITMQWDTVLLRIRVLRMPQLLKSMTNSRRSRKLLHIIFKEKNPLDAFMNHQIRVKFSSYE